MKKCLFCHTEFRDVSFFYEETLCAQCRSQVPVVIEAGSWGGYRFISLYQYNESFRSWLLQLKMNGDIVLANVFLSPFGYWLRLRFLFYHIVPAPSTLSSNEKRGFNHVESMCAAIGWKCHPIIQKDENWKQSNQTWANRKQIRHHVRLLSTKKVFRRVLLVDDIRTSGETLLACAALLKQHGVKKIVLLAIANNTKKEGKPYDKSKWKSKMV